MMIVTELTRRLGGRNDAMTAEHSTYIASRSGKLKSMKSGKLRSLQRILSPLNVVLDTLRKMSSLQLRSREVQSSFSDRRLKLPSSGDSGDRRLKLPPVSPDKRLILLPSPPSRRRKKKLVFHPKQKHSYPKFPHFKQKSELKTKQVLLKSIKHEAFRERS